MATTKKRAKRPVKFAKRGVLNLVDPRVFATATKRANFYKLMRNENVVGLRRRRAQGRARGNACPKERYQGDRHFEKGARA